MDDIVQNIQRLNGELKMELDEIILHQTTVTSVNTKQSILTTMKTILPGLRETVRTFNDAIVAAEGGVRDRIDLSEQKQAYILDDLLVAEMQTEVNNLIEKGDLLSHKTTLKELSLIIQRLNEAIASKSDMKNSTVSETTVKSSDRDVKVRTEPRLIDGLLRPGYAVRATELAGAYYPHRPVPVYDQNLIEKLELIENILQVHRDVQDWEHRINTYRRRH